MCIRRIVLEVMASICMSHLSPSSICTPRYFTQLVLVSDGHLQGPDWFEHEWAVIEKYFDGVVLRLIANGMYTVFCGFRVSRFVFNHFIILDIAVSALVLTISQVGPKTRIAVSSAYA